MFDDLETETKKPDDDDERRASLTLERWAHFPAMLVFGLMILVLHGRAWGWRISIAGGYAAYVLFFALGSGKTDLDDLTGDQDLARKVEALLVPIMASSAVLLLAVSEWFQLKPVLPSWITHEYRKGSFWDLLGWMVLVVAGIVQGSWMARRIQRKFRGSEESE